MNPPPEPRGLSLTLSYGGGGGERRVRAMPLGGALRVVAALALSACCFQAGRWAGRLETPVSRPASAVVVVEKPAGKVMPEATGIAAGGPNGENDVITPLNVRDPSALVMGPSQAVPPLVEPPATPEGIPEPVPPAKTYKRIKDIKPNRRF